MSSKVTFNNKAGDVLVGDLVQPVSGAPVATCLFAHCFTCSRNVKAARNISRALSQAGFAVLRFDFTGLGQSAGEFADTNFSHNVDDLVVAADFLRARGQAPTLLVGHSLGGTAVLKAAQRIPESQAVATIGSPADPAHVAHLVSDSEGEIRRAGAAKVNLGGRPFTIKKQFLGDLESQKMSTVVRGLRRSLLIMHSPADKIVGIDNASELFALALHPKSFVSLDDTDHLLSAEADSLYAGAVLAAWASRYVGAAAAQAPGPQDDASLTGVRARTRSDGFYTEINAAGHALQADEPVSYGGNNRGPSPYDLLSAALAACTSMTLGMYARHKELALREAHVTVTHSKIHAKDCEHCESTAGKIDRFERRIALDGDLDEDQRQRMLEIADRCPVHRTLEGEIDVVTALADVPRN
ncbi:MAG: alpha/beta fold hydrolase [Gammaproteobacteria bacterium]|nr:alpha/beta fold hydrolase [Gammaproteobacteria bacterium]